MPLLRLRLAFPEVLVDVGSLPELTGVRDEGSSLLVGAMTTHYEVTRDPLIREHVPLLAAATATVADPAVRHRGTFGGSLAHADPAGDLPAVVLALDATLVTRGPSGGRQIAACDFFTGLFETALEPGELLTEIRLPKPAAPGWSFVKFAKRAIDWAIVGVAVQGGSVALVNMAETPLRAAGVERALAGGAGPREAAAHAAEGTRPAGDINAGRGYREHLARVLVARALEQAAGQEFR
jgi:carbon-monoxide dehydrogenase medium subunit